MYRGTVVIVSLLCSILVGCASESNTVKDPVKLQSPIKNRSALSASLTCFGDLLAGYRHMVYEGQSAKPLTISIQSVKDATGISNELNTKEIPNDMTDMAIGIASSIGGALRIAHVPSSQERIDASYVRNMGISTPEMKFKQYQASNLIYGALTEYDRSLGNKKNEYKLGSEFGGGQGDTKLNSTFGNIRNVSRMSMDFRIIDNNTGQVFNSLASSNTVLLTQLGSDQSYGLSVNGNAIGYVNSETEVDARHAAIRLLIERGLIETIGKLERVPYWRCLPEDTDNQLRPEQPVKFGNALAASSENKITPKVELTDENVIADIKMDFEYGDYEDKNGLTRYTIRDKGDRAVEGKQPIAGKLTKIDRVLSWYNRNDGEIMSKRDTPSKLEYLRTRFKQDGIISEDDNDLYGVNMYMALWLNAPYRKNARWEP